MKGDFTRDTFDKNRHYSRVLLQQGRVQLDADFNEQAAILLHQQRTLAADLIGPHGVPAPDPAERELEGFKIGGISDGDFKIGSGHYYVDGILCENDEKDAAGNYVEVTYKTQADYPLDPNSDLPELPFLVYLDVWEQHLTYVEQEDAKGSVISIRESALNGPDTATRAKVVWQVKTKSGIDACPGDADWKSLVESWQPKYRGLLKATAVQTRPPALEDHCITPPESRYYGEENQLYRVEIHKSGTTGVATFKWSRDNGSVIFPVTHFAGEKITLETLGYDQRSSLDKEQWVELVDDDGISLDWRENKINPLGKITSVDHDEMTVTVEWSDTANFPSYDEEEYNSKHVFLRRWDQRKGQAEAEFTVNEVTSENDWIELENGIQIQFQPAPDGIMHEYRSGDYWLIPARAATGDVEWPGTVGDPKALPPHGVEHHYAPLAIFPDGDILDCRNMLSRGDAADVTPAEIGALAESDYDLRRTTISQVSFDQNIEDGGTKTFRIAFRPSLILVSGACSARMGLARRPYGGTFSSFVDLREGRIDARCAPLSIIKFPGTYDWQSYSNNSQPYLSYVHFEDRSFLPMNAETLTVSVQPITQITPAVFEIVLRFRRTPALAGAGRLAEFRIDLELCCLG